MQRRIDGRPGSAALASFLLVAVATAAAGADAAKGPARKDSSERFRPKEATFSTSIEPESAKAGETVAYRVTARIQKPWHIYQYAKPDQTPADPRATRFDLFDAAGLAIAGDWSSAEQPHRDKDEVFANVEFFEDEVTWSLPLRVPPGTEAGPRTIRSQISFQICDPKGCKNRTYVTVPEVVLTILPGGEAAAVGPDAGLASTTPAPEVAASPEPASTSSGPTNEVERSLEQGLVPFLLLAMTGGLIALVMPCVWPMVPITVNFFVKQGQAGKGKTLGLAITYCLAIIGIFTLVGVLFSAFFGAAYLQRLANAAWLNIAVSALFLAFGLSLLGLFEFRLPNFLLNATSKGESRGGLVGVVFMALTLTITSFTCTFPVVGGLLVMAARGSYLYPVIGLATFATVLALPFFLLALAPGLLAKVPKGGDWMNSVKVVGGLVEIGAAFKFINTAECAFVTPENAWFDAQAVLAIWVVLCIVCGIYLLGLFRTDHDYEAVQVGPGRIVVGALFLCLGLYLAPALFGAPPRSKFFDRVVVGILPADAHEFYQGGGGGGGGELVRREKAASNDPKVAVAEERTIIQGIEWGMSYPAALEKAKADGRPVLIDFTGVNCANCRLMERNVFPRPEVVDLLGRFQTVQLYTDFVPIDSLTAAQREDLAMENQVLLADLANESTNPFYVVLNPAGEVIATIGGYREPSAFVAFLEGALAKHRGGRKVAQVDR